MFRFFVVVVFVSDELYPLRGQCTVGGTLELQQVLTDIYNSDLADCSVGL